MVGAEVVADFVSEDLAEVGIGALLRRKAAVRGRHAMSVRPVVPFTGAGENVRAAAETETSPILAGEQMDEVRPVLRPQLGHLPKAPETFEYGPRTVQRRGRLGHVHQTGAGRHRVVPQHEIQEVHRGLYRRPGRAITEPLPDLRRLHRVENENVEPIVVRLAGHGRRRVGSPRSDGGVRRRQIGHDAARAELRAARRSTQDRLIQPAQAVPAGTNPVGRPVGFSESTLEVPILDRQDDAVVVRAREPARPHHVAVSPILERTALGDQNPAVRPLELQALGTRAHQIVVDDDRRSGRAGRGAPLVSGGRKARELLALSTGSDQQQTKTGQQAATYEVDPPGAFTGPEPHQQHKTPPKETSVQSSLRGKAIPTPRRRPRRPPPRPRGR